MARVATWVTAALLGAVTPAVVFACVVAVTADQKALLLSLLFALIVTLAHALLLGLPIALFYRTRRWTGLMQALLGGLLIGALPIGLLVLPTYGAEYQSVGGVDLVANGARTFEGWISYLRFVGMIGGLGAIGALAFWLVLWLSGELKVIDGRQDRSFERLT